MRSKTKYFIIALLFALIALTSVGVSKWNIHIQHQFNNPFSYVTEDATAKNPIIGRYLRIQNGSTNVLPGSEDAENLTYNGTPYTVAVTDKGNSGETDASAWSEWKNAELTFNYYYTGTKDGEGSASERAYASTVAPKDAGTYTCRITAVAKDGTSAQKAKENLNIFTASDGNKYAAEVSFTITPKEGNITGNITSGDTETTANVNAVSNVGTIPQTAYAASPLCTKGPNAGGNTVITLAETGADGQLPGYFYPAITDTSLFFKQDETAADGTKIPYYDAKYNGATKELTLDAEFVDGVIVGTETAEVGFEFKDSDGTPLTDLTNVRAGTICTATAKSLNPNYKVLNKNFRFKIVLREITVKIDDKDSIYGDPIQTPTCSTEDLVARDTDGLDKIVKLTTAATSTSNVGTYNITGTKLTNDIANNYTVKFENATDNTKENGTYTINPRVVELSWTNTDLTYNKNAQKPTANVTNLVNGDAITVNVNGAETNANANSSGDLLSGKTNYTATAASLSGSKAGNYTLTGATATTCTFKIKRVLVTAPTAGTNTFTYNGEAQTYTPDGYIDATMNISGNAATNVDSYTATVSLKDSANYEWAANDNANKSYGFTITPLAISVTAASKTITYGENFTEPTFTITAAGYSTPPSFITRDLSFALDKTTATPALTKSTSGYYKAGTYTLNIAATEKLSGKLGNYTITKSAASYTINKLPVTLTWDDNLIYNGGKQKPTATISNKVGSDVVSVTVSGEQTLANAAGNGTLLDGKTKYKATLTLEGTDSANYALSSSEYEFIIKRQQLTRPTAGTNTFTYDGTEKTYTPSGYTAATMGISGHKQTIVGEYNATISLNDSNNYEWSDGTIANYTLPFSISKAQLTVPTNDNTYEFTGSNQYSTILSGFGNTYDPETMTVNTIDCTNAVEYTFTFGLKDSANYEWKDGTTTAKSVKITISQATIDLSTFSPNWKCYDGNTEVSFTGNPLTAKKTGNELSVEITNLDSKLQASYTDSEGVETNKGTEKGTYNTIATITVKPEYAANYKIGGSDSYNLTWQISSKTTVTVPKFTAPANGFIYNGSNQYNAIVTAFNDTYDDTKTIPTLEITKGGTSVGVVEGKPNCQNAGDYTFTFTLPNTTDYVWSDGTTAAKTVNITINAKAITVTWSSDPLTYNGTNQIPSYTLSDTLCGSDTLTTTVKKGTSVVASYANAGDYSVTLSATSNYTLTNSTTDFKIKQRTLTITNTVIELGYNEVKNSSGAVSRAWKDIETTLRGKITLDGVVGSDKVSVITKTLTNGDITYNYNGTTSYSATYLNNYKNTSVTNNFVGSTYQATSLALINNTNSNYVLAENSTYYLKYKTVWHKASGNIDAYDNSTLYTIEDALNAHSSGTIIVELNTSFTGVEIATAVGYLDDNGAPIDNYYNVRCTLLVPYAATANLSDNSFKNAKETGGDYNTGSLSDANDRVCATTTTAKTNAPNRNGGYSALIIPSNLNINVTGTLTVNAVLVMTTGATSYVCGAYYGEMIVNSDSKITLESGATFNCVGFTRGSGSIVAESNSKVNEPLSLTGYKGHDATLAMSDLAFPINQFTFTSLSCTVTLKQGANYYGKGYLHVHLGSGSTAIDLYIVKTVNLLGTANSFFIQLESGEFTKVIDEATGKITFGVNGNVSINNMNIYNEKVPLYGRINISTADRQIPLAGHFKFEVQSGTLTIPSGVQIKLLPGAELTVDSGANLVVNGGIYSYGGNNVTFPDGYTQFKDGNKAYPVTATANCYRIAPALGYTATKPATFTVQGTATFNSNSTLGVEISGLQGGKLVINTSNVRGTVVEDNSVGSTANMYNVTLSSRGLNNDSSLIPLNQGEWNYENGKWLSNYYQIIYNSNGDSNAPAYLGGEFSDLYAPSPITSSTITTPDPTRIYHTFTGWYYDAECTQKVGEAEHATPAKGDVINVYAGWRPTIYTVHFEVDRAGYSDEELGMPSGVTYSYGTTCVLPQPNFNIAGLEFSGWKIYQDYTGDITEITTDNIVDLKITDNTATITIYGQFKQADLITVRFDRNANLYTTEDEAKHKLNSLYAGDALAVGSSQIGGVVSLTNATSVLQGIDSNQHEYYFNSWNTKPDGSGKTFINNDTIIEETDLNEDGSLTLYAQWSQKAMIYAECFKDPKNVLATVEIQLTPAGESTITIKSNEPATKEYYYYRPDTAISYKLTNKGTGGSGNRKITGTKNNEGDIAETNFNTSNGTFLMPAAGKTVSVYSNVQGSCLVEGTLVTLADGTQKKVEDLTYDDLLLVFNHTTGQYEASPMLLNAHTEEDASLRRVIYLTFSDGTRIGIVVEHAFFDIDLNKYVYISEENAKDFVGHRFAKLIVENNTYRTTSVTLTNVEVVEKFTKVYSPVAYLQLSAIVEGLWGVTESINEKYESHRGYINIFDFDENMNYDLDKMNADIEKYGLYTYDEFSDLIPYEEFMKGPWRYYKVSEGKGKLTKEDLRFAIKYVYNSRANQGVKDDLPPTFPWDPSITQNTSTGNASNSGEVPIPPEGACDNALPPATTTTTTGSSEEDSSDDKSGSK